MALARSTVRNERSRVSLVASIGGYLAILVVTFGATLMAAATALGENRPPEDKADSTIAISVVASVVIAAVAAVSLRHTRRPFELLALPASVACLPRADTRSRPARLPRDEPGPRLLGSSHSHGGRRKRPVEASGPDCLRVSVRGGSARRFPRRRWAALSPCRRSYKLRVAGHSRV